MYKENNNEELKREMIDDIKFDNLNQVLFDKK